MATRSRPAQGNNSSRPFNRPRPAYRAAVSPTVVSSGSLSHPRPNHWGAKLQHDAGDATPKVVTL